MPKSGPASKPSRSWCFTLNNWTPRDRQMFLDLTKSLLVMGEETGAQGTRHLQGAIRFKRAYRLSQLKKICPKAHWEAAVTIDPENYCMKEDYVIQDNRVQGKRTDLEKAIAQDSYRAVAHECPVEFVKYHAGLAKWYGLMKPAPRRPDLRVLWFHGATGTGKTWTAWEEGGPEMVSVSLSGDRSNPFLNGYLDQKTILIDDIRSEQILLGRLLTLLDIYPSYVNIKGGSVPLLATLIIVTSPYPPEVAFAGCDEDKQQLRRRITEVRLFE